VSSHDCLPHPAHLTRCAGHTCVLQRDGFYAVSFTATVLGVGLGLLHSRLFPALEALPLTRWRAAKDGSGSRTATTLKSE
jgi:hypothetical protein